MSSIIIPVSFVQFQPVVLLFYFIIYLAFSFGQMKYMEDDSTVFWGISNNAGVVARHAEEVGKSVEMVLPFEDDNMGEVGVFIGSGLYCFQPNR